MTDLIIDLINKQAKEEKHGIEFSKINKHTTVNGCEEGGSDSDSYFEGDDKSYKTSANLTLDSDNELPDNPDQSDKN